MKCRVCNVDEIEILKIKTREYYLCKECGSICLSEKSFISREEQKDRYEKHHNSLSDAGYRSFLEAFINPVLDEIGNYIDEINFKPEKILDYGSGPEPALCELMRQYAAKGDLLPDSCEIRGWDPFFAPEVQFFESGADLVTCLEVAEHFETPLEDMKKLAHTVKAGGYAAIGTMLLPENCDCRKYGNIENCFKNWWYRSDSTHTTFYTLEGLKECASYAGLDFKKAVSDRAFLFKKRV